VLKDCHILLQTGIIRIIRWLG